jgi:hypothetical protein
MSWWTGRKGWKLGFCKEAFVCRIGTLMFRLKAKHTLIASQYTDHRGFRFHIPRAYIINLKICIYSTELIFYGILNNVTN